MIRGLYRLGQQPEWDGQVNEGVAEIFGLMLMETRNCSSAFKWLPTPPGGRASIVWRCTQLARGVFKSHSSKLSFVCARTAIYKWGRQLDMASMGLAAMGGARCA